MGIWPIPRGGVDPRPLSGSETSDPFLPPSPQIWSNDSDLEVRSSIKIAFGTGSARDITHPHLPSPQVNSTNQLCVYFLIYFDNYGNLSSSRKFVILSSFLGNGVRARVFFFSGSDLGNMICTCDTVLIRLTRQLELESPGPPPKTGR